MLVSSVDGRTFLSLISTTITFGLFIYAVYCAIVSYIAERAEQRDTSVLQGPNVGAHNRRVAARLAFGAAALLAVLAFTATAASWPPLRKHLDSLHGRLLTARGASRATLSVGNGRAAAAAALPAAGALPAGPSTISPPPVVHRRPESRVTPTALTPAGRASMTSGPLPSRIVSPASPPDAPRTKKPPRPSGKIGVGLPEDRGGKERAELRERSASEERPKRVERKMRVEQGMTIEPLERPATIDRNGPPERVDRVVRVERTERIQRPERRERPERPHRIQGPERSGPRR